MVPLTVIEGVELMLQIDILGKVCLDEVGVAVCRWTTLAGVELILARRIHHLIQVGAGKNRIVDQLEIGVLLLGREGIVNFLGSGG